MENATQLGGNKTGIHMSPKDTAEMEAGLEAFGAVDTSARGDVQVRADYADEADALGSVPPPGTVKGVLKSGVDMITGKRPQVLIDKLGERLAFERGGVRLYETLLAKCSVADAPLETADLAALTQFHDEEAEHMMMVVDAIRQLGADPTAQTPCADLVGVESMGLVQAMNDPRTSLVQSLHVMLDAELLDNAGWEMLIDLANRSGHADIAKQFAVALQQEARHLAYVRALVERLTAEEASLMAAIA
jgi:rubrerythrin